MYTSVSTAAKCSNEPGDMSEQSTFASIVEGAYARNVTASLTRARTHATTRARARAPRARRAAA